jgi:hypothetical protein
LTAGCDGAGLCYDSPGKYGDIELGLFLVRGDSVVLLGEVDPEREKESGLVKVTAEVRALVMMRACVCVVRGW